LPADFKEHFKDGVYITQGFDRNLMVLTREAFEQIYTRVMTSNLADPLARLLMRMLLGNAYEAEIDDAGGIRIQQRLKDFASLAHDVILVGLGDYLELWSPEHWNKQEEQLSNVEANTSRFSSLVIVTR
jgi:MraZ protein